MAKRKTKEVEKQPDENPSLVNPVFDGIKVPESKTPILVTFTGVNAKWGEVVEYTHGNGMREIAIIVRVHHSDSGMVNLKTLPDAPGSIYLTSIPFSDAAALNSWKRVD